MSKTRASCFMTGSKHCFSVFGTPHEALAHVFDILLESLFTVSLSVRVHWPGGQVRTEVYFSKGNSDLKLSNVELRVVSSIFYLMVPSTCLRDSDLSSIWNLLFASLVEWCLAILLPDYKFRESTIHGPAEFICFIHCFGCLPIDRPRDIVIPVYKGLLRWKGLLEICLLNSSYSK